MFFVDVKTHRNFPAKLDYQAATVMVMFQLLMVNMYSMHPFLDCYSIQWFSHDPIDSGWNRIIQHHSSRDVRDVATCQEI